LLICFYLSSALVIKPIFYDLGVDLKPLEDSLHEFKNAVVSWKKWVETLDLKENPLTARYVNDQVLAVASNKSMS